MTQEDRRQFIFDNQKCAVTLAMCILEECPNIIKCQDVLYNFNGRHYDYLSDGMLLEIYSKFIMEYNIFKSWKIRNEVIQFIYVSEKTKKIEKMNDYSDLICVFNGILNIKTRELSPHSPEYYIDTMVQVDFDSHAYDCPVFHSYLNQTFNNDQDTIDNIIRLGGYLLDSSNQAGKMFLFDGQGSSGKSTLIETFQLFFTESQITALSLEDLSSNTFDKELLLNSRLNVAGEQKKSYLDAEEIKKIVTGDKIKIARKFKLAITFRPKCKIVIACNGLPKFNDTSEGIYRRLVIVRFKNQYKWQAEYDRIKEPEKRRIFVKDLNMLEKIKLEKTAVLNLFLEGLTSLINSNYEFKLGEDSRAALQEFKVDNDVVREFLEDCYEINLDSKTPVKEVYVNYKIWYRQNVQDFGAMKFRTNEMGRRIKEVFGIDPLPNRVNFFNNDTQKYENLHVYNIKLKEISDFDINDATEELTIDGRVPLFGEK